MDIPQKRTLYVKIKTEGEIIMAKVEEGEVEGAKGN